MFETGRASVEIVVPTSGESPEPVQSDSPEPELLSDTSGLESAAEPLVETSKTSGHAGGAGTVRTVNVPTPSPRVQLRTGRNLSGPVPGTERERKRVASYLDQHPGVTEYEVIKAMQGKTKRPRFDSSTYRTFIKQVRAEKLRRSV